MGIYYTHGLGYAALPVGEMFFLGILFPTLGYKIWKFSRSPEVITLTDIVARRYEEDHWVRAMYALTNIIFMFFLMGVQVVGIAYVVEKVTGGIISYREAVFIVAFVLIVYQSLGGMRGVAYTDALQLVLLTLTLICVLAAVLAHFDLTEVFRRVASGPKAAILSAPGPEGVWNRTYWSTSFVAFGLGWFLWPHLWARNYCLPGEKEPVDHPLGDHRGEGALPGCDHTPGGPCGSRSVAHCGSSGRLPARPDHHPLHAGVSAPAAGGPDAGGGFGSRHVHRRLTFPGPLLHRPFMTSTSGCWEPG